MRAAWVGLAAVGALAAAGCGSTAKPKPAPPAARASIQVSSDFKPGAVIPRVHTCDGRDVSVPLRAAGLPAATEELIVVMRDPDAPGGVFIHWAVALPRRGSAPMVLTAGAAPAGAVLGRNSFGTVGYRGPCPPAGGAAHHYHITVYALRRPSALKPGFSADAVAGLPVIATGSLTGLYARH
jgi:Raf kinase inhibitor-like YbhB/YbcL family protein